MRRPSRRQVQAALDFMGAGDTKRQAVRTTLHSPEYATSTVNRGRVISITNGEIHMRKKNEERTVDERVEELERHFHRHDNSLLRVNKDIHRHARLLKVVDEHKSVALLDRLSARITEISRRLQTEMLKTTVASEVSRLYPETWPNIVRAFDQPDDWWNAGDKLTIAEWPKRLNQLHGSNSKQAV